MSELVLAFDTSGPVGSVALARAGETLGSRFLLNQSRHASALIPAVSSLLEGVGATPDELTGLVVGAGPGSFTGVRVAAATAKGLAGALGIPVWAVSSLLAGAASGGVEAPPEAHPREREGSQSADGPCEPGTAPDEGPLGATGPVAVLFDARGDRIYAAAYEFPGVGSAGNEPLELIPPVATTVGGLLDHPGLPPDALLCGDGAVRHSGTLAEAGFRVARPPMGLPTAEGLLRVHRVWPSLPPLRSVGDWEPDYLRSTGAQPLAGP